jgi:hypothetical protein
MQGPLIFNWRGKTLFPDMRVESPAKSRPPETHAFDYRPPS